MTEIPTPSDLVDMAVKRKVMAEIPIPYEEVSVLTEKGTSNESVT